MAWRDGRWAWRCAAWSKACLRRSRFCHSACAATYGSLRPQLETLGKSLAAMDLLIAAHALAAHCPLVTADRAFAQVPGLSVVEWSSKGVTALTESPASRVRTKLAGKGVTPTDVDKAVAHARTPVGKTRPRAK